MSKTAPHNVPLALVMVALAASTPGPLAGQRAQAPARPQSGWIGVQVEGTEVRRVDGTVETDLVVTGVVDGTPADQAGFRPGDRIVRLNGRTATFEYFRSVATNLRPGDRVRVAVSRDRWTQEVDLEAVARPAPQLVALPPEVAARIDSVLLRLDSSLGHRSIGARNPTVTGTEELVPGHRLIAIGRDSTRTLVVPAWSGDPEFLSTQTGRSTLEMTAQPDEIGSSLTFFLGGRDDPDARIELARIASPHIVGQNRVAGAAFIVLNSELATYFEVPGGLLVTDVTLGTPAAEGGIRAGDVITRVGDSEVTSLDELRGALSRAASGGLPLSLVRRGEQLEVTIPR